MYLHCIIWDPHDGHGDHDQTRSNPNPSLHNFVMEPEAVQLKRDQSRLYPSGPSSSLCARHGKALITPKMKQAYGSMDIDLNRKTVPWPAIAIRQVWRAAPVFNTVTCKQQLPRLRPSLQTNQMSPSCVFGAPMATLLMSLRSTRAHLPLFGTPYSSGGIRISGPKFARATGDFSPLPTLEYVQRSTTQHGPDLGHLLGIIVLS
jgi:hypothetical protein